MLVISERLYLFSLARRRRKTFMADLFIKKLNFISW